MILDKHDFKHNHPLNEQLFQTYLKQRHLNPEEIQAIEAILGVDGMIRKIHRNVQEKTGKKVTKKDLFNLKSKMKVREGLTGEDEGNCFSFFKFVIFKYLHRILYLLKR